MSDPLKGQVDNLTQQRSELISEIGSLKGLKQTASESVISLAETKGRMQAEVTSLQKEKEALINEKGLLQSTTENEVSALQVRKDTLLNEIKLLESNLDYLKDIVSSIESIKTAFSGLEREITSEKHLAKSLQSVISNHAVKLEGVVERLSSNVIGKASEVSDLFDERVEKLLERERRVRLKERELKG